MKDKCLFYTKTTKYVTFATHCIKILYLKNEDFCQNTLADNSIDTIVTDPPWGHYTFRKKSSMEVAKYVILLSGLNKDDHKFLNFLVEKFDLLSEKSNIINGSQI